MKNQILWYSLSVITATMITGCGTAFSSGESCNSEEPAWTSEVAPMETREDGGEATAVVRSVDMMLNGELFGVLNAPSNKVSNTSAQEGLNLLTTLLTPNMSSDNPILKGSKTKNATKTPSNFEETNGCFNEGGTFTLTYTEELTEDQMHGEYNENLTFSFNNCVMPIGFLGYMTSELYDIIGEVIEEESASTISTNEELTESVTLNGKITAAYKGHDGDEATPDWMGSPSWSVNPFPSFDTILTLYDRAEIRTNSFSAEFTSESPESFILESDMNLYFENRLIDDIYLNEPFGPSLTLGFIYTGEYFITGANGCLKVSVSVPEEGTFNLMNIRTINLENVNYYAGGTLKSLNGFIEASMYEGEFAFSLKADEFYRQDGYIGPVSKNVTPRPPSSLTIQGYLGSSCLEGMLFINGNFGESEGDQFPTNGYINFSADELSPSLGNVYFNYIGEADAPLPSFTGNSATLFVAEEEFGPYYTWTELIGYNDCNVGEEP